MKDNKLQKETVLALAADHYKDDKDTLDKVQAVVDACKDATHEDRCEAIFVITECTMKEAEVQGIDVNF
jgi:PBP/GOBP family